MSEHGWPSLPTSEWHDTLETVHLWTQVIGKIRMVQSPWLNHSWNVPLYVTPTGLATGLVPHGTDAFEWTFDLADDRASLVTSSGLRSTVPLTDGLSVADFYARVMAAMDAARMPVTIHTTPSELADAIPFEEDTVHATYVGDHIRALHGALLQATRVFERFRAGFRGKASRVHFFWGSFDLAVTRFSGREAPVHPGGIPNFPDDVAAEAYSHEVTSVGFWPGNRESPIPIFYGYAYPTPDGFSEASVAPDDAFWLDALGEFALPYDAVLTADDPDDALLAFCETTHSAAADLAGWDRRALECDDPHGPDWFDNRPHEATGPPTSGGEATEAVVVEHDDDGDRFVILVDGVERGAAVYRRRGDRWVFVHTETDPAFEGRGLASQLARTALDEVERQGGQVVPLCPFISGWIERHPDYRRLVDESTLERMGWNAG